MASPISPFKGILSHQLPHILLVEDNLIALRLLETLIEGAGCKFTSTMDAEHAFDLVKKDRFDLIISDIGLPGMSGIELTIYIRNWEKESKQWAIPIVGLTAHCLASSAFECIEAGMNHVFTKPMTALVLSDILSDLLPPPKSNELPAPAEVNEPFLSESRYALEKHSLFDINQGINNLGSMALLRESLSLMMDELSLALVKIQQGYKTGDWGLIGEITLRMRSSAIYCGTVRLQYVCQSVQIHLNSSNTMNLNSLYPQLIEVIDHTQQTLNRWLGQQK